MRESDAGGTHACRMECEIVMIFPKKDLWIHRWLKSIVACLILGIPVSHISGILSSFIVGILVSLIVGILAPCKLIVGILLSCILGIHGSLVVRIIVSGTDLFRVLLEFWQWNVQKQNDQLSV